MNRVFLYDKRFSGEGKNLVKKFISEFQIKFFKDICQYARLSKTDQKLDHLFWYGEQQLKTAATSSLSKLCNGYVKQEPGVSRKVIKSKKGTTDYKNGRVDYFCRFGKATKVSLLVEMKQAWIRYYTPKKWTLYSYALVKHQAARKQIHSIEKNAFIIDNLYGAALTILPMFTRHDSPDETVQKMNIKTLNLICENVIRKAGVHACSGFLLPEEFKGISDWSDKKKQIYESYPGLIFLWSIYKFTKK